MLRQLFQSLLTRRKWSAFVRRTPRGGIRMRARLELERLESREVPAVIPVTSGADSGPGTLRDAIILANADGDEDTIQIDPSVTRIGLESSLPATFTNMNINGPSGGLTRIEPASGRFRIFEFDFNGTAVSIANLHINGGAADEGAAIKSWANLTVTNCLFTGNTATESGGAIHQILAPLTVSGSTFTGNTAGTNGGGISFESGGIQPLTVTGSTFDFNTAGVDGGAIFYEANGEVTIDSSSFFTNSATTGNGGAINCAQCASLSITSPPTPLFTTDMNTAGGSGGMIFANVEVSLTIDTNINGNSARGQPPTGGFLINLRPAASFSIDFARVRDSFVLIT